MMKMFTLSVLMLVSLSAWGSAEAIFNHAYKRHQANEDERDRTWRLSAFGQRALDAAAREGIDRQRAAVEVGHDKMLYVYDGKITCRINLATMPDYFDPRHGQGPDDSAFCLPR